jgi:predicted choloylglycine hydrolase
MTNESGGHELRFRWLREERPGPLWVAELERLRDSYVAWFAKEGDAARPDLASCADALETYMPELVPTWEELLRLAGGGADMGRLLSLWCPTPYLSGCTQAVLLRESPILVRNYDYRPDLCEGTFLLSRWHGTRVLAAVDCLWGVLDGLNEHGLAVALSFGGRDVVGEGFGIPLVLRYALEFCRTTPEAAAVLERVPSHMAYNVSLLDVAGRRAVVAVAPDRPTAVRELDVATNHQEPQGFTRFAKATKSAERERFLYERLSDPALDAEALTRLFLEPPLFNDSYERAHGTLYTAVYRPRELSASFLWQGGLRQDQSFDAFEPRELDVSYGLRL